MSSPTRSRHRTRPTLAEMLRTPRHWRRFVVLTAIALFFVLVLTVGLRYIDNFGVATRDVLGVARAGDELEFYTGWGTFAGAWGWISGFAFAALAGLFALRTGRPRLAGMLLALSALSAILGVDDLFSFHDGVLNAIGIPENATLAFWGLLAIVWGFYFLPELLRDTDLPIFVGAVVLLAHGAVADQFPILNVLVGEAATKFGGIFLWAAWIFLLAMKALGIARDGDYQVRLVPVSQAVPMTYVVPTGPATMRASQESLNASTDEYVPSSVVASPPEAPASATADSEIPVYVERPAADAPQSSPHDSSERSS